MLIIDMFSYMSKLFLDLGVPKYICKANDLKNYKEGH